MTLNELERRNMAVILNYFTKIQQLRGPHTSKWLKLDLYCLRKECGLKESNSGSSLVYDLQFADIIEKRCDEKKYGKYKFDQYPSRLLGNGAMPSPNSQTILGQS